MDAFTIQRIYDFVIESEILRQLDKDAYIFMVKR